MQNDHRALVDRSIDAYERAHRTYEDVHGEIFNDIEQTRLRACLQRALSARQTSTDPPLALDLGCGTGNLTQHLLAIGAHVTAADVSTHFLDLIRERFRDDPRVTTLQLNGLDLDAVGADSYDFVGAYSVLHHIPDYLRAIEDAVRILKPGGVLYLDHEHNERHWNGGGDLACFYRAVADARRAAAGFWHPATRRWQRALVPATYVRRLRLVRNPDHFRDVEGDIHTHQDDHIEWDAVVRTAERCGARLVTREDYLLYRPEYPIDLYAQWSERCDDITAVVLRKS